MSFNSSTRRHPRQSESGYILLTLLLIVALMTIFAATLVTSITFSIKRDREEEMIHRGTQYSRAIRAYYKKFGRYPTKIEDLESANNMRFLRKRYKDPITGKDFKLLHFGEVKLTLSGMTGTSMIPGASPVGGAGTLNGPGGLGPAGGAGQISSFGANSAFGANSNSSFGQNQAFGQNQQTTNNQATGSDPTQAGTTQPGSTQPGAATSPDETNSPGPGSSTSSDKLAGTTFGGGPIVGVASISKDPTIREFDHKNKYNQWQFVYDPATDRGQLITTPNQPLQGFGQQNVPNLNGQINGQTSSPFNNQNNGGFGNGIGGQNQGLQNNPGQPVTGGPGTPSEPPSPQQQ